MLLMSISGSVYKTMSSTKYFIFFLGPIIRYHVTVVAAAKLLLWKRKVVASVVCQICWRSMESISHVWWSAKQLARSGNNQYWLTKALRCLKAMICLECGMRCPKNFAKQTWSCWGPSGGLLGMLGTNSYLKGRNLTQVSQLQKPKQ